MTGKISIEGFFWIFDSGQIFFRGGLIFFFAGEEGGGYSKQSEASW